MKEYFNFLEEGDNITITTDFLDNLEKLIKKADSVDKAIEYINNASYFDGSSMCANDLLEILGDKEYEL